MDKDNNNIEITKSQSYSKAFDSQFYKMFVPLVILIVLFLFLPYLLTTRSLFDIDFSDTGQIGDTIGGILGPFIAIGATLLTFLAFWVQYKANEQQKVDLQIERFENKFYNMVQLHKTNVSEIKSEYREINNRMFISMINELKFLYLLVNEYYNKKYKESFPGITIAEEVLFNISYLLFFYGEGKYTTPIIVDIIGEDYNVFYAGVEHFIQENKSQWNKENKKKLTIAVPFNETYYDLNIEYLLGCGHSENLSHYFRNLYQIVQYIDTQDEKIFSYNDKFNYVRILRSQLSIHQQLLIYYNSLSILGQPWIKNELIQKYCFVKNIPIALADFYKKPLEWLPLQNEYGKNMFEISKVKTNLNNLTFKQ